MNKSSLSLIIFFVMLILYVPTTYAAPPRYCDGYAQNAVLQFQKVQNMGIYNLPFPVWSDDYQHHYQWCLSVSESDAQMGEDFRAFQISKYASSIAPASSDTIDKALSPTGPLVQKPGEDFEPYQPSPNIRGSWHSWFKSGNKFLTGNNYVEIEGTGGNTFNIRVSRINLDTESKLLQFGEGHYTCNYCPRTDNHVHMLYANSVFTPRWSAKGIIKGKSIQALFTFSDEFRKKFPLIPDKKEIIGKIEGDIIIFDFIDFELNLIPGYTPKTLFEDGYEANWHI